MSDSGRNKNSLALNVWSVAKGSWIKMQTLAWVRVIENECFTLRSSHAIITFVTVLVRIDSTPLQCSAMSALVNVLVQEGLCPRHSIDLLEIDVK